MPGPGEMCAALTAWYYFVFFFLVVVVLSLLLLSLCECICLNPLLSAVVRWV